MAKYILKTQISDDLYKIFIRAVRDMNKFGYQVEIIYEAWNVRKTDMIVEVQVRDPIHFYELGCKYGTWRGETVYKKWYGHRLKKQRIQCNCQMKLF